MLDSYININVRKFTVFLSLKVMTFIMSFKCKRPVTNQNIAHRDWRKSGLSKTANCYISFLAKIYKRATGFIKLVNDCIWKIRYMFLVKKGMRHRDMLLLKKFSYIVKLIVEQITESITLFICIYMCKLSPDLYVIFKYLVICRQLLFLPWCFIFRKVHGGGGKPWNSKIQNFRYSTNPYVTEFKGNDSWIFNASWYQPQ